TRSRTSSSTRTSPGWDSFRGWPSSSASRTSITTGRSASPAPGRSPRWPGWASTNAWGARAGRRGLGAPEERTMAEIAHRDSGASERVQAAAGSTTVPKPAGPAQPVVVPRTLTWWGDVWRRFSRQRVPMVAGLVLIALVLVAVAAPALAPYDPTRQF